MQCKMASLSRHDMPVSRYEVLVVECLRICAPQYRSLTSHLLQIHYELAGSHDNKFAIDRNTGELRLINSLDYETKRQYNFEVRAVNNPDG